MTEVRAPAGTDGARRSGAGRARRRRHAHPDRGLVVARARRDRAGERATVGAYLERPQARTHAALAEHSCGRARRGHHGTRWSGRQRVHGARRRGRRAARRAWNEAATAACVAKPSQRGARAVRVALNQCGAVDVRGGTGGAAACPGSRDGRCRVPGGAAIAGARPAPALALAAPAARTRTAPFLRGDGLQSRRLLRPGRLRGAQRLSWDRARAKTAATARWARPGWAAPMRADAFRAASGAGVRGTAGQAGVPGSGGGGGGAGGSVLMDFIAGVVRVRRRPGRRWWWRRCRRLRRWRRARGHLGRPLGRAAARQSGRHSRSSETLLAAQPAAAGDLAARAATVGSAVWAPTAVWCRPSCAPRPPWQAPIRARVAAAAARAAPGGGGGGGCGGASVGIWIVGAEPSNGAAWRMRAIASRWEAVGEGGAGGGGAQTGSSGARGETLDVVVQQ